MDPSAAHGSSTTDAAMTTGSLMMPVLEPNSADSETTTHRVEMDALRPPRESQAPIDISSDHDYEAQANKEDENLPEPGYEGPQNPTFDPRRPMEEYDWSDLECRFHEKMNEFAQQEQGLYEEFDRMMAVKAPPNSLQSPLYKTSRQRREVLTY
jgi:hypothetical protein